MTTSEREKTNGSRQKEASEKGKCENANLSTLSKLLIESDTRALLVSCSCYYFPIKGQESY
jgi:hypothetical protein